MENNLYFSFLSLIMEEKKEDATSFSLNLLEKKTVSVKDFYIQFIIPSMKHIRIEKELGKIKNWQERKKEGILKTIIECTYSYIVKEKSNNLNKKVLIASPEGEYEQVGAMIANNIFVLLGFEVHYLGANLEENEILEAIKSVKPDYYTIGLKNYYNAFETKRLIESIKELMPKIKIIVGGPVFKKEDVQHSLYYDFFVRSYEELFELAKEIKNEISV